MSDSKQKIWTAERCARAIAVLRATRRADINDALALLTAEFGLEITWSGLQSGLFRYAGTTIPKEIEATFRAEEAARAAAEAALAEVEGAPTERQPQVIIVDDRVEEAGGQTASYPAGFFSLPGADHEKPEADRQHVDHEAEPTTCARWTTSKPMERILFIPDCHFPYVDRAAWAVMLRCAEIFKPHRIVQMGDFVDCFTVSDHSKDPRRGTQLEAELVASNEALDELDALGAEHKHITWGNHENRLYRYLCDRAPALLDTVRIEKLLRLDERGWTHSAFGTSFRIGNLYVTHSVNGQAGENAHHRAGARFQKSVVIGHTHRIAHKVFGNVTGERFTASMFGWVGQELEATYNHDAEKSAMWSHGFGIGYMLPSGDVHVQVVPIVGRHAVLNGEIVGIERD